MMEIAILMSTYNGEKFLSKQLESLSKQTINDSITVYIRDDGSTDNTINIINYWKTKMNIILFLNNNLGPAKSFWVLLTNNKIKADYYAFCDQDDIWDYNKLEVAINQLKEQDADLYLCNCRLIDANDKIIENQYRINFPDISLKRQFVSGVAQGCCMVFTDKLRLYFLDKEINCIPMHDLIIIIHAIKFGKIVWDPVPRFGYRIHLNNVVAKSNKNFVKNLKKTYKNWKNSSINSMANVASDALTYCKNLTTDEIEYLTLVKKYKDNIRYRIKLIIKTNFKNISFSQKRSFILKVMLKLY